MNRCRIKLGLAAAACAVLGITIAHDRTNELSHDATNFLILSNSFETPFLTISNRAYLHWKSGVFIVRLTDDEWKIITNHYPDKLETNNIVFSGK